jgi:branched-chain amino acid transport system ATP-binding protein
MILSLSGIECFYGKVRVVKGLSLSVASGEVVALLGRNGAGKTTTLKAIMGLVACRSGAIRLDGEELSRRAPHLIPRLGVGYVPQGRRLFPEMSVAENLQMGLLARKSGSETRERVLDLFPVLRARLRQIAGTLSGGEQQMLAMGRALCLEPKVMLLDEPCEGLQPSFVEKVLETVVHLKGQGVALLIVEQKVDAALRIADRVAFLENGALVHETPATSVAPQMLERYVGVRRT